MNTLKVYLILILFALVNQVQSNGVFQNDTTFNQKDKNNLKQGFWKKVYPNGKIAYQGFFKDDKPRGIFKRYHEGGTVKAILSYSNDGISSKAKLFYPNGKLAAEGLFYNNQKDSIWKYYSQTSRLVFEESYKKGLKDGLFKSYYEKGSVYETISWKDGKMHGNPIKIYYFDGKVKVDGNYKDGLKDGSWKMYDPEGKLVGEMKYINGIAENNDKLLEKESEMLKQIISKAGTISEPSVEDFLKKMGGY
jgi:antitoxin component YwqK of YwqJK toxin-antitoxin module